MIFNGNILLVEQMEHLIVLSTTGTVVDGQQILAVVQLYLVGEMVGLVMLEKLLMSEQKQPVELMLHTVQL